MANVKVKMNRAGVREVLQSDGVQNDLLARAKAIAASANASSGGGYAADVIAGKNRARAVVKATDRNSAFDNSRNNTLAKSIDAGR